MKSFVFQIHCVKEFRLYEALQKIKNGYTIVLSPKPDTKKNPPLEAGATVYIWEAGPPQRGLVARGTVIAPLTPNLTMPLWQHPFCQQPHQVKDRSILRIDHKFIPPLPGERLRKVPALAEASFFGAEKNPMGTIFYVKPKTTIMHHRKTTSSSAEI